MFWPPCGSGISTLSTRKLCPQNFLTTQADWTDLNKPYLASETSCSIISVSCHQTLQCMNFLLNWLWWQRDKTRTWRTCRLEGASNLPSYLSDAVVTILCLYVVEIDKVCFLKHIFKIHKDFTCISSMQVLCHDLCWRDGLFIFLEGKVWQHFCMKQLN